MTAKNNGGDDLVVRKPDQIATLDALSERIRALEAGAVDIATETGEPFLDFALDAKRRVTAAQQAAKIPTDSGWLFAAGLLLGATTLTLPGDFVSCTKHGGKWALCFHRQRMAFSAAMKAQRPFAAVLRARDEE